MDKNSTDNTGWHQDSNQIYSATLTGNPFLYQESRRVAALILEGHSLDGIRAEVLDNNLFGYRTTKSIPKRVNAIHQRLLGAPRPLLDRIARGSAQEGKLLLILLLAANDRLFREFMQEVVAPKLPFPGENVTDSDFRRFFERKTELDSKVSSWTDPVKTKLKTVITAALVEAGLFQDRRSRKIVKPILDPDMSSLIKEWFDSEYLQLLVGK